MPSPITAVLPEGCVLETLNTNSDGTLTKSGVWRPKCQSIFEFVDPYGGVVPVSGNARFYRLDVVVPGDIAVRVDSNTSRHIVLRSADGALLGHVYYHTDYPNGGSGCYGMPCAADPVLEATLPTGAYIVETVQHYNGSGRQRSSTVTVEGTGIYSVTPRLAALSVDATSVAGFHYNTFAYELARAVGDGHGCR